MNQELNNISRKPRRPRSNRNRPVLVTSTSGEENEQSVQEAAVSVEEPAAPLTTPTPVATVETAPTEPQARGRKLAGFFSTIGKKEVGTKEKEAEVTQARIARATRGKATATTTTTTTTGKSESTKAAQPATARASNSPARSASAPPTPFKTRYIIGMGVYLLAANFIGAFETQFVRSHHLDSVLAQFDLFGGKIVISTSTLLFLATLIIILVLLARFDLIPRSLSAIGGGSATQARSSSQSVDSGPRPAPPTIRQGVKGADDDLYQQYRTNQRKEKKK